MLGRAEWSGISEVPGIYQTLALTKFCFVSSSEKAMPDRDNAVGLWLRDGYGDSTTIYRVISPREGSFACGAGPAHGAIQPEVFH
jgi:hypothetical protein